LAAVKRILAVEQSIYSTNTSTRTRVIGGKLCAVAPKSREAREVGAPGEHSFVRCRFQHLKSGQNTRTRDAFGERTRLACCRRRLAAGFVLTILPLLGSRSGNLVSGFQRRAAVHGASGSIEFGVPRLTQFPNRLKAELQTKLSHYRASA
jgi:hypothetical protein